MEDKNVGDTLNLQKEESRDFGFVGYREYKESEFYKRYERARSAVPQETLNELDGKPTPKPRKKIGVGSSVFVLLLSCFYVALCVIGYVLSNFLTLNVFLSSLFGVFDGKNIVTAFIGFLDGDLGDIVDMIGFFAMAVACVLALFAFIGGIVCAATGKGFGKVIRFGCFMTFLTTVVSIVCEIIRRLDITIGISVLVILSGIIAILALTAPRKEKEKD